MFPIVIAFVVAGIAAQVNGGRIEKWSPPLGLDLYMPVPEDNPLSTGKIALGRQLFTDTLLSRDGTRACATCHDPARAFTDGRAVTLGVLDRTGTRSAPALINRGYGRSFFWDGRAATLEEQVVQPIVNPNELDLPLSDAIARLQRRRDYADAFLTAFGRTVNPGDLARALASYVRCVVAADSPVDRYLAGDSAAVSDEARQGLSLFQGKAKCSACHVGPTLSDEQFHNTGVAWKEGRLLDVGRFAVTGKDSDRGAFKTPTLREIARTAPYMHDGSITTLEDVIAFYDRGGNANAYRDAELRPLGLTAREKHALLAFLGALSGTVRERVDAVIP